MKKKALILLLCIALTALSFAQREMQSTPKPYVPIPTSEQVAWQRMEMNMFCHFGPNTFTGLEWGEGTEAEDVFNPQLLDCNQWVDVAKHAGFKGIIITAKHHDGFCLWPNPASNHTVRESSWRNGKGDILRELSDACHKGDIKFGIYISPWDRNAPTYGTPKYNKVFIRTLKSAHSNYGDIFEQWFDGANGEGPNGKRQIYDWKKFNKRTLKLQPNTIIFSDVGPGCRWVGNEEGTCGRTCWSRLDIEEREPGKNAPSQDTLNSGNYNGTYWIPAETDVSIRDGWFWRDSEHPKSVQELLKIYYNSVGRNSLLLLNVPPDNRGLIPAEDSLRLMEFRQALDSIFAYNTAKDAISICASNIRDNEGRYKPIRNHLYCDISHPFSPSLLIDDDYDTYWATDDSDISAEIMLKFDKPKTFNRVVLQEYIPLGQRVEEFSVEILDENNQWRTIAKETTIGYKRILLVETYTTKAVRIYIEGSRACPVLNNIGLYLDKIYSE